MLTHDRPNIVVSNVAPVKRQPGIWNNDQLQIDQTLAPEPGGNK